MKVINLLDNDFNEACHKLARLVKTDYSPDVLIGVLTGGGVVARAMLDKFDKPGFKPAYLEYKVQRNLTTKKEKIGLRKLLVLLPSFMVKLLINVEVQFLELKSKIRSPQRHISKELHLSLKDQFQNCGAKEILIVDDCIDTGATLKTLIDTIKQINSNLIIRVAVITVTHNKPVITPDYQLFSRTICRFPWSMEVSQKE